jgi:hypothetical protein
VAESRVAVVTEKPTNLVRLVIVVDMPFGFRANRASLTDCADPMLSFEHREILLDGDTVAFAARAQDNAVAHFAPLLRIRLLPPVSLRSKRRWAVFDGPPERHFFLPHDPTAVARAKRAVQAAKKLVDRMLLELGPLPRFVAGRPFIAGADSFIVGSAF